MKTQQLRAFIAVATEKSIRGAARTLGLTQPAITRVMRELEAEFDVPLIRRSAAGIELTEYGAVLEVKARLLIEEMRRTRDEFDRIRKGAGGTVSFGASPTAALTIVPRAFEAFAESMPNAQVTLLEVNPTPGLQSVRDGSFDFLVTHLLDQPDQDFVEEFECLPLFSSPFVVVARRKNPDAKAGSLAALLGKQWCIQAYGSGGNDLVRLIFQGNGLAHPRKIIRSASFSTAFGFSLGTDTFCILTRALYELDFMRKSLVVVPVKERLPRVTVAIIWRKGVPLSAAAAKFVAALIAAAQQFDT